MCMNPDVDKIERSVKDDCMHVHKFMADSMLKATIIKA